MKAETAIRLLNHLKKIDEFIAKMEQLQLETKEWLEKYKRKGVRKSG